MNNDQSLRNHLATFIDWGNAHLKFADAVKNFPPALRGVRPAGSPHSAWELLEHLRLAQQGHSRIRARRGARLARVSGRLLAVDRGAAE